MLKFFLIFTLFTVFYSFRLNYPPQPYFDEVPDVMDARSFAHLSGPLEMSHPPMGRLMIALSIHLGKDAPFFWRLPSLICAAGATALSAYLALLLTGSMSIFWLTALILACDGLWITQARMAMLNAPMVFFIMACLVCWWKGRSLDRGAWWLLSGVCAGFAAACKWQGALVLLIPVILGLFQPRRRSFWIALLSSAVMAYFLTFLIIPCMQGWHWQNILYMQSYIAHFHLSQHYPLVNTSFYSAWYTWPFLIHPLWMYQASGMHHPTPTSDPVVTAIFCQGNPFIFALMGPSMLLLAMDYRRDKSVFALLVLTGILVFWLPSAMIAPFRFTMFQHFYPVMPFVAMGVACVIDRWWQATQNALKILSVCWLAFILLSAAFFFPLWTGLPISYDYFMQHMWLHSWFYKVQA